MKPSRIRPAAVLVALLLPTLPSLAMAQNDGEGPARDYGASFLQDFDRASDKLLQLAEAIPPEKYAWRPTPEVRSVSEVFVHVAVANGFLSNKAAGIEPPAGLDREAEARTTEEAEVIALLKASQELVRRAVAERGGDFSEQVDFFWGPAPVRDVFLQMAAHSHEHLGQMIAYARMAGVTPPWSRPRAGGP